MLLFLSPHSEPAALPDTWKCGGWLSQLTLKDQQEPSLCDGGTAELNKPVVKQAPGEELPPTGSRWDVLAGFPWWEDTSAHWSEPWLEYK